MQINTIYPTYIKSYAAGYACQSILEGMNEQRCTDVKLFCTTTDKINRRDFHNLSVPPMLNSLAYRFLSPAILKNISEWNFKNQFKKNDVAYIWPSTSLEVVKKIRQKASIVVLESINTHQSTSKFILDNEYTRLGLKINHGIKDDHIKYENDMLGMVDYIYSPGDEVAKSLLNANVPESKVLHTSYGLKPVDILPVDILEQREKMNNFTVIFIGRIGVRKGVHLLLDFWVKSGVKGKLKLIGNIESNFQPIIEPYLKRTDIEHISFANDLRSLYKQADVFVLPSLEEGSPLVTYLALGAGLPSIVSPMGGGGVIETDFNGFVIDPYDEEKWVESFRLLSKDMSVRKQLSINAYNLASKYLWSNVGKQRLELLKKHETGS